MTHEDTLNKRFDWNCPQCRAPANDHGFTPGCEAEDQDLCEGLLCKCDEAHRSDADHGQVWYKQCQFATCDHCGWSGRFPMSKDIRNVPKWAVTAIENGWTPAGARP